jgi:hypothetical protein
MCATFSHKFREYPTKEDRGQRHGAAAGVPLLDHHPRLADFLRAGAWQLAAGRPAMARVDSRITIAPAMPALPLLAGCFLLSRFSYDERAAEAALSNY